MSPETVVTTLDATPCGFRWPGGGRCGVAESHDIHNVGWPARPGYETHHEYVRADRRRSITDRRSALRSTPGDGGEETE